MAHGPYPLPAGVPKGPFPPSDKGVGTYDVTRALAGNPPEILQQGFVPEAQIPSGMDKTER